MDFGALEAEIGADCETEKQLIIRKLISSGAKVKSFVTSDFDVDGPYTYFLLSQQEKIRELKLNITPDDEFLRAVKSERLRRLSLHISEAADEQIGHLAPFLQLQHLQYLRLECLSRQVSSEALQALSLSNLPSLQVIEVKFFAIRPSETFWEAAKHIKSVAGENLRCINVSEYLRDAISFDFMMDMFLIPPHQFRVHDWTTLEVVAKAQADLELFQLRFNGNSVFRLLSELAARVSEEYEYLPWIYNACYPSDKKLTLRFEYVAEIARELAEFIADLDRLDRVLNANFISFMRSCIESLIPAALNRKIQPELVVNPVTRLVFQWSEFLLERGFRHSMSHERELISRCIDVDSSNAAAVLLWCRENLAGWYFGPTVWNWEVYNTRIWPQQLADLVANELWRLLLMEENRIDIFRRCAESIRRAFPQLPERISMFVTGEDRRKTGPLECKLRVREARRLLREIISSRN